MYIPFRNKREGSIQVRYFYPIIVALMATPAAVSAGDADCNAVPPEYRIQCEEGQRLNKVCGDKAGKEHEDCVSQNVKYNKAMACENMSKEDRADCEASARMLKSCQGKTGDDYLHCMQSYDLEQ